MPRWAKTFVLLTGMLMWVAMIGATIWLKQPFGTLLVGFPAGLWYALTRRSTISEEPAQSGQAVQKTTEDPAP